MKIKKYRPNFVSGFEDVYYEVNDKEELFNSDLCKYCIDNGYEICFSRIKEDYGLIMAIREEQNEDGAEWWVLAITDNAQDVETLSCWLPDWDVRRKEYKDKKAKGNQTELKIGEYFIPEGCTAKFVGRTVVVYKRKSNKLSPTEYRCKDCKHRGKGYCFKNQWYKTCVCELKPKGEGLFYGAPLYGKVCDKFEKK